MSTNPSSRPTAGTAAALGGAGFAVLGAGSAVSTSFLGAAWFIAGAVSILLLVAGLLGLRQTAVGRPVARAALTVSAAMMTLFGLSHFYAVVNEDRAVVLFSVFMVLASVALIVAGVAIVRRPVRRGWTSWLPLLCGVWPILTVPVGAAMGDVPHFTAIAIWGLTWIAYGLALRSGSIIPPASYAERADRAQLQHH